MTQPEALSPYLAFTRDEWAGLRGATPLTLDDRDLEALRGLGEPISLDDIREVYLPISRLLDLHYSAVEELHRVVTQFLGSLTRRTPYLIGLAGSVSSGKSTTARVLTALLSNWPGAPRVALVTTDGFLFPNRILAERGLMERKGFPESYDVPRLIRFVSDLKSARFPLRVPRYSHLTYDVLDQEETLADADLVILEGLNVLQTGTAHSVFVSDYIDFSIYLDAPEEHLEAWFLERFKGLRETAFRDPRSYFHAMAAMSEEDAVARARGVWERINLANLRANIAPTREKATLVLEKGRDHRIERVLLRRF